MLHNIQASIKEHLEANTGLPCLWIYDGVTLPDTRPILTIEALSTTYGTRTKLREAVAVSYRYQIGVICKSSSQAAQLPYAIADLFTFSPVPMLDTANGGATIGEIDAKVTAVTPIPYDQADSPQKHKAYIDVIIARYRVNNGAF